MPSLFLRLVLVIGIVSTAMAAPVTDAEVARSLAQLEDLRDVVDSARELLPVADLDLQERAMALAMDADEIIAWVRGEVTFDAYPGVLRGARGALLARSGNAWDQALLAATLLRRSGYQTYIARGRLTEAEAVALVGGTSVEDSVASEALSEEDLAEIRSELAAMAGADSEAAEQRVAAARTAAKASARTLTERVGKETTALLAALKAAGVTLSGTRSSWEQEARDYAWVRYRKAAGDPWLDCHPAFATLPDPAFAPVEASRFEAALPKKSIHRIRYSAYLEFAEKGKVKTVGLMEPWVRPVANMAGTSVTLSFVADGFRKATDRRDAAAAFARTMWIHPMFEGKPAPRSKAFDLRGFAVSPDVAAHPMAKIFSTAGSRVLAGIDRLDAATGDEGPGARELTAVWIEVGVKRPGQPEVSHRRFLFDRIGAAARRAKKASVIAPMEKAEMVARLHGQHELVVLTGDFAPSLRADREFEFKLGVLSNLAGPIRALRNPAASIQLPRAFVELKDPRVANAVASLGAGAPQEGVRSFRHGPGVFLVHRRLAGEEGRLRQQIDIVQSPRRAVDAAGRPAPEIVFAAGVRETMAEAARPPVDGAASLASAIAGLEGRAKGLTLIRDAKDPALAGLGLDATVQANLEADLNRGYLALVAEGPKPSWWRVHPSTGEATGVTPDGAGSETTEYIEALSIGLNSFFTTYGALQCKTACCVATTVIMGVGLTGAGMWVGAPLTEAAGMLAFTLIMDLGVNAALSQIVPPPCNG